MRVQDSPFDSTHYDLRIGRLVSSDLDGRSEFDAAVVNAKQQGFDLLLLRLAQGDQLCEALDSQGYPRVETLVTSTLQRDRRPLASTRHPAMELSHHARIDDADDIRAISAITSDSIENSHFHADSRLPIERTRQLYAAWARNDVTGRAQRTIVARIGRDIVGYVSVLDSADRVVIDLVAVRADWRGKGIGSGMISSLVNWIGARDVITTVGTQADNPALGLYMRCGFLPTAMHDTYHLWLIDP